jgi:AcrR family transcriptional regulator
MSPRSKQQNELIKDERREQLLNAALKVFAHKGLAAAKIGDIASAAKLSHGLVYHYFSSTDDIFTELVRRAIEGATSMMIDAEKQPLEPLQKLRYIASMTLGSIDETEDSAYYFYLMMQAHASDAGPELARESIRSFRFPTEVMLRIVEEGQAKGQIRKGDPMEYATAFWAAIQGLAVYKVANGQGMRMPDSDLLIRMFEPNR